VLFRSPKCKEGKLPIFVALKFQCMDAAKTASLCEKDGKIYNEKRKRCVKEAKKSSSLDQDLIFKDGRKLAYGGLYEDAIDVLSLAPNQGDPRILNMLGFSSRKLGRMDIAFSYYQRAVATDPDFSLVREYLGEAYIQLGLLEKAREQLTEIERICGGRTCSEYSQLASLMVKSQTN